MATSGSVNFTKTRDELITLGYKSVNLIQKGETLTADEITFGADILNEEIKFLSALCPHLWKRRIGYLFPETDQFAYAIGTQSGDDNIFNSYVTTQLNGALAISATAVIVDDVTDISSGDIIGISLDTGKIHWDIVNGAPNTSTNTITLTTGVTEAVTTSNRVYTGTTKISRPVKVFSYWRETISSDESITRTPIIETSYDDYYLRYGSQTTNSIPTHAMFDNRAVDASATLAHGIINILPSGDQSQSSVVVGFIYETQLEDFDSSTDNPDLPSEWLKLLRLAVSRALCTSDGVPDRIASKIESMYQQTMTTLLENDSDDSTFFIEPNYEEQAGYKTR